jgi:hypothetical protein
MDERSLPRASRGWSWCGEAWTDGGGRATVAVPFEAGAYRFELAYELQALGCNAPVTLVEPLHDGSFTLASGRPHVKVAWRLTPLRAAGREGLEA